MLSVMVDFLESEDVSILMRLDEVQERILNVAAPDI